MTVEIDLDIDDVLEEFDVDEILDRIPLSYIREYAEERTEDCNDIIAGDTEEAIRNICALRCTPCLLDKKTAKRVMSELIDDLFAY